MNPKIWGPKAWFFLHSITFNYPENPSAQEKKDHYDFFKILGIVLPCETCKKHYEEHLGDGTTLRIALNSRTTFISWLIDIHNQINVQNGSPISSEAEVMKMYNMHYVVAPDTYAFDLKSTAILAAILLCTLLLMRYFKC